MKSGVYRIINTVNGMNYVGSSPNLEYKYMEELNRLRSNHHDCKLLQKAFNQFGEASFAFEILFFCDKELLLFREAEMIDYYQADRQYNRNYFQPLEAVPLCKKKPVSKVSPETRSRMRLAKLGKPSGMKGKQHSETTAARMSIIKRIRLDVSRLN